MRFTGYSAIFIFSIPSDAGYGKPDTRLSKMRKSEVTEQSAKPKYRYGEKKKQSPNWNKMVSAPQHLRCGTHLFFDPFAHKLDHCPHNEQRVASLKNIMQINQLTNAHSIKLINQSNHSLINLTNVCTMNKRVVRLKKCKSINQPTRTAKLINQSIKVFLCTTFNKQA